MNPIPLLRQIERYAFHNDPTSPFFQKNRIIINTTTNDIVLFGKGILTKKTDHNNTGLKMNIAEFTNGATTYRIFITDEESTIFIDLADRSRKLPRENAAVFTSVKSPRRRKRQTRRHRRS